MGIPQHSQKANPKRAHPGFSAASLEPTSLCLTANSPSAETAPGRMGHIPMATTAPCGWASALCSRSPKA
eukprot:CAMPEP_0172626082 /NCGR_PEP_ID=MMETSP1068-20121228/147842_1 /TAXON_ID=35684 /ORGANISM="Pseudopedinella elastica, Strain CCMP716" /LENGTH=69 /DNA_ID=CAMNT_0013435593 /DNA_START=36 /DNA_END=242 /DNA_ORIENTATION=-